MRTMNRVTRRGFLGLGCTCITAYGLLAISGCRDSKSPESPPAGASDAAQRIPIGVQLYSVRHECERDLPATLKSIAEMGYEGVEFAGYYDRSAAELRTLLDQNGLMCCGTHLGLDTLLGDELEKTIEFNKTLGNHLLIVPWLPEERRDTREHLLETAGLFNELAAKVAPHGMRVGYHNHEFEFEELEGEEIWDIFFGNTVDDVVMQVDIGNALSGGGDPTEYLSRYPGRAASIHVKEYSASDPDAYVGEGDVNWESVFDELERQGGTEWYIVEYEREGSPPLESIRHCLENLKRMGK